MAFSGFSGHGSAANRSSGNSLGGSPSSNITSGRLALVSVVTDNTTASGTPPIATSQHTSVVDTDTHTWTKVFEYTTATTAEAGVTHSLWATKTTTTIGTGDTITVNLSSSRVSKLIVFSSFAMGTGTFAVATTNAVLGVGAVSLSGLTNGTEYLLLHHIAGEGESTGANFAKDAAYTLLFTGINNSVSGAANSNVHMGGGYLISSSVTSPSADGDLNSTEDALSTLAALWEPPPTFNGTAAASMAFTVSAAGYEEEFGTGSASIVLSASGAAYEEEFGTAAASMAFTAEGVGALVFFGTAGVSDQIVIDLFITSAAGGEVSEGTGSADLVLSASGVGAEVWDGTAAASMAFTASGEGIEAFEGTAAATIVFDASGHGTLAYSGTSGVFDSPATLDFFITSADGEFDGGLSGTAAASIVFTASGAGEYEPAVYEGTAAASIVFSASGAGHEEQSGTAAASMVVSASGEGSFIAFFFAEGAALLAIGADGTASFIPFYFGTGSAGAVFGATGHGDENSPQFDGTAAAAIVFTAIAYAHLHFPYHVDAKAVLKRRWSAVLSSEDQAVTQDVWTATLSGPHNHAELSRRWAVRLH